MDGRLQEAEDGGGELVVHVAGHQAAEAQGGWGEEGREGGGGKEAPVHAVQPKQEDAGGRAQEEDEDGESGEEEARRRRRLVLRRGGFGLWVAAALALALWAGWSMRRRQRVLVWWWLVVTWRRMLHGDCTAMMMAMACMLGVRCGCGVWACWCGVDHSGGDWTDTSLHVGP